MPFSIYLFSPSLELESDLCSCFSILSERFLSVAAEI